MDVRARRYGTAIALRFALSRRCDTVAKENFAIQRECDERIAPRCTGTSSLHSGHHGAYAGDDISDDRLRFQDGCVLAAYRRQSRYLHIKIWDTWYLKQVLVGRGESVFHRQNVFFPQGVITCIYHPLFLHFALVSNALQNILPVSNAFSLTFLLSVTLSAFSAYTYLLYILKDTWIALFGAVVFAFSPHVLGHPHQPAVGFIATFPLILYFFHRGIMENRRVLIIGAGLLSGLNTFVIMYVYVCALMTLGLYVCAFAWRRWRQKTILDARHPAATCDRRDKRLAHLSNDAGFAGFGRGIGMERFECN